MAERQPNPKPLPIHEVPTATPLARRNVFDNEYVSALCLQYRQNEDFQTYEKICAASNNLIDSVVRVHRFHLQAPFEDIKNHLFLQFRKWIFGWDPNGIKTLFTYFSTSTVGCTKVLMADGSQMRMKEVIQRFKDGEMLVVQSYNTKTGQYEAKEVTDYFENGCTRDQWRKVSVKRACGPNANLFFTQEHEFWTAKHGYVRVRDLDPKVHRLVMPTKRLTLAGKQAVLGMCLGDGHVSKRYGHFVVSHGEKQAEYTRYIARKFEVNDYEADSGAGGFKPFSPCFGAGFCLKQWWPTVHKEHNLKGVKRVTRKMLDQLGVIGLAFWFMDDGDTTIQGNVIKAARIHTDSFTEDEKTLINEWFAEQGFSTHTVTKSKGHRCTAFSAESARRFLAMVAPYFVPCVQYKLPQYLQTPASALDSVPFHVTVSEECKFTVRGIIGHANLKTRYVKHADGTRGHREWFTPDFTQKYDITVADNRNFIADGVLVSNCAKHGSLSYIQAEARLHARVSFIEPDKYDGCGDAVTYKQNFDFELRQQIQEAVMELEVRWTEPVIREVIKYLVSVILSGRATGRRQQVIRTVTLGYEIQSDDVKFLLDWTHGAIRARLLEKYDTPLGEIDVIRLSEKFSFIPDLINLIGIGPTKQLMTVFAGQAIRFPSQTQLRKTASSQRIFEAMEKMPTPATIDDLATKLRTSPDRVRETHETMCRRISEGLLEDLPLYNATDEVPVDLSEGGTGHD